MNVNGHWYTETEAQAYIITLEHKNAALEDKHLSECRQISEYDAENKALREFLTQVRAYYGETESWVDLYEEKFGELIGEGNDIPATVTGTNVGRKSGGWISVKDRLPEEEGDVLVWIVDGKPDGIHHLEAEYIANWEDGNFYDWDWNVVDGITHWQPLPESPKED